MKQILKINFNSSAMRTILAVLVSGVVIGLLGGVFLKALKLAATVRVWFIDTAVGHSLPGWLAAMLIGSGSTIIAVWMAYHYAQNSPQSAESDTPRSPEKTTSPLNEISVNFAGTSLAVGAGLALGPERPAIQMGGAIGRIISKVFNLGKEDQQVLLAAAGGAGVATMFNSPLGCAAYTVETVLKRVNLRISSMALGVGAIAVAITRFITGRDVNFMVDFVPYVDFQHLVFFLFLGCIIAVFASLHVAVITWLTRFFRLLHLPVFVKAALVGAGIGLLAGISPDLVGAGESQTQTVINGGYTLSALGILFIFRFFIGPLSLSASTPGGYFTPVLLLGALSGSMFGMIQSFWVQAHDISPAAMGLVGMAVALAAVANAPFTGILLVLETTGAFSLALPMIAAVIGAMVVTRILQTPPLSHGLENDLARMEYLHLKSKK